MPNDVTIYNVSEDLVCTLIEANAYTERKEQIQILFSSLFNLNKEKFKNKKIIISSGDYPENDDTYKNFDYKFSTTVPIDGDYFYNEFPCPHSISWPVLDIFNVQEMLKNMIQDKNEPVYNKIFWAGGPQHSQRFEYKNFSSINSDICETHLTDNSADQIKKFFIKIPDHSKYKYLIDIQGQGYSARIKYLLATGRPVFLPQRKWVEHWHRKLIPWIHYIPLKDDFSDLRYNYNILEKDTSLYSLIGQKAKEFVLENILLEKQLPHILNNLK